MGLSDNVVDAVVVGVDGSEPSLEALDWAADQARLEKRRLTLVHAATLGTLASRDVDRHTVSAVLLAEGRQVLHDALERAVRRGVDDVRTDLVVQEPSSVLLDASRHAALVVVGSRRLGRVRSLLLGSTGVALTRRAICPVVVHRRASSSRTGRGVLADAGAPHGEAALEWAADLAAARAQRLTLVHTLLDRHRWGSIAADEPGHEAHWSRLREVARRLGERHVDLDIALLLERGLHDEALLRVGADMDVVVLGSHPDGTERGLLDRDVSTRLVERVPGTVAVVPCRD